MKLRILDNSIRIRFSQSEVQELYNFGLVESSMAFGPGMEDHFKYIVQCSESEPMGVRLTANKMVIIVPMELINTWAISDQVSIECLQHNGSNPALKILIEKDFKCLTKRPDEDETDLFPNPEKAHKP